MSQRLAADAVRLCGLVCRQLGWRPADFWEMTPAEVAAVCAGESEPDTPTLSRSELEELMEQHRDG